MGRHSAAPTTTPAPARRVPVRWIAVCVALVLVGVAVVQLLPDQDSTASPGATPTASTQPCDGELPELDLVVGVPAAIAPALRAITDRLADDQVGLADRCIVATVDVQPSHETAAAIAGGSADVPDVWVSDSRVWLQSASQTPVGSARLAGGAPTIARSPLVLAMSQAAAERSGWPDTFPSWPEVITSVVDEQSIVLPDPTTSSAGLALMMTATTVLGDSPEGRRATVGFIRAAATLTVPDDAAGLAAATAAEDSPAVPTTEQTVVAFNATRPARPLVAVYPGETQLPLEYTLAAVHLEPTDDETDEGDLRVRAAVQLQRAVLAATGQDVLADAGFRGADGATGGAVVQASGVLPERGQELAVDPGTSAARSLGAWRAANLDAQILAVLDVSKSMAEVVADGRTRLQVATSAAGFAISLFPPTSEFGLWSFSTDLAGGADHLELVPIGSLGDPVGGVPRSQALSTALAGLVPTNGTSLYDTTLDAYKSALIAYDSDKINSVVLLTDGVNDDNPSISLDALVAELERLSDAATPVQIVYVAIGPGVDVPVLERIASATGGAVYQADRPEDIEQIYLDAVARRQTLG